MDREERKVDGQARVVLPRSLASTTVIVERVDEDEVRIRRTDAVPEKELPFVEETPISLSDRDRDRFLELLANSPSPNTELVKAAARHKARRG